MPVEPHQNSITVAGDLTAEINTLQTASDFGTRASGSYG